MKQTSFILLLIMALLALSLTAAQAQAFDSPLPTPQLTPPFRATPTGWPNAPFPWQTPAPRIQRGALVIQVLPTLAAEKSIPIGRGNTVAAHRARVWPEWKWRTLE